MLLEDFYILCQLLLQTIQLLLLLYKIVVWQLYLLSYLPTLSEFGVLVDEGHFDVFVSTQMRNCVLTSAGDQVILRRRRLPL